MRLIIPFSRVDLDLAPNFPDTLKALGCSFPDHSVYVSHTSDVAAQATDYASSLLPFFGSATAVRQSNGGYAAYPEGANIAFREAVVLSQSLTTKGRSPWFFFELDCTPITPDWLTKINSAYSRISVATKENPICPIYLGHVKPAPMIRPDGVQIFDGKYMIGAGVYPWNHAEITGTWRGVKGGPFDLYARYWIGPRASDTPLIQSNGRSQNYRLSDDRIVCDKSDEYGINDPINPEAVVVHGCKDGSLSRLITLKYGRKRKSK